MRKLRSMITPLIACVWIANGLFCKVLNLTPRHEQIVGTILTFGSPRVLTVMIGFLEIGMAIWILSGFKRRLSALLQVLVIAFMNVLEFFLVPHLLLWGRMNAIFALIFIAVILLNEFYPEENRIQN